MHHNPCCVLKRSTHVIFLMRVIQGHYYSPCFILLLPWTLFFILPMTVIVDFFVVAERHRRLVKTPLSCFLISYVFLSSSNISCHVLWLTSCFQIPYSFMRYCYPVKTHLVIIPHFFILPMNMSSSGNIINPAKSNPISLSSHIMYP